MKLTSILPEKKTEGENRFPSRESAFCDGHNQAINKIAAKLSALEKDGWVLVKLDEGGLRKIINEISEFQVGLFEDKTYPKIKSLLLKDGEGDFSYRLSHTKATGNWKLVSEFICSASPNEIFPQLDDAIIAHLTNEWKE